MFEENHHIHSKAYICDDEQSNGMTVEQIQKFLGHASSTTTQNYIATITTSTIEKGRIILEKLMSDTE
ncbi:MAG: hypothetical protein J5732_00640 [Bacteroidaceae bacterium]|nr:hypothetical protein [Bacteroidaceae bacterium]